MEEKTACHVRSVCARTACGTGISKRKQKSEQGEIIARHSTAEPHMVDKWLPGIQRLNGVKMSPANPRYVCASSEHFLAESREVS